MTSATQLLDLAETALEEGHPETTLELCRQVLSEDPLHPGATFLEAEALRDLREAPAAEDRYRRVLAVDPHHAEAWSGMGSALWDQGRFDEAAACFTRAVRSDDASADGYYGRAMARERRGDLMGAKRDYVRAWRLSARYPLPQPVDDGTAKALLVEAAADAEPTVQAWMAQAPVVIVDLPDLDTCEAYDPPASPSELLGHVAAAFGSSPTSSWSSFPPAILLYRRNLERYADDHAQLVHALRHGVVDQVAEWLHGAALHE